MQFAKDSVYVTMRDRLAGINPDRVIAVHGNSHPAVLVGENLPISLRTNAPGLRNVFELYWGSCETVSAMQGSRHPLMKAELRICYTVEGTDRSGNDRGRELGEMDAELIRMCTPRFTPKQDYIQTEPAPLGSNVFWGELDFSAPEDKHGVLRRTARLAVFFFPEAEAA